MQTVLIKSSVVANIIINKISISSTIMGVKFRKSEAIINSKLTIIIHLNLCHKRIFPFMLDISMISANQYQQKNNILATIAESTPAFSAYKA